MNEFIPLFSAVIFTIFMISIIYFIRKVNHES